MNNEMTLGNTLILMACGGRKRNVAPSQTVPLLDLYAGPLWSTLRKHLGDWYYLVGGHGFTPANVVVLSGQYGLIRATDFKRSYEARLTEKKADRIIRMGIGPTVLSEMAPTGGLPWRGVIVCGGSEYRRVFAALVEQLKACGAVQECTPILTTSGGIGVQRSQLGQWIQAIREKSGPPSITGASSSNLITDKFAGNGDTSEISTEPA